MTDTGKSTLDVGNLEIALCRAGAYMASAVSYEDAVIFVGTTKSGKSSLVNFLIGNRLIGERRLFKIRIIKADNAHGPQIGVEASSETAIPTRYLSQKLPGCAIWDAPGFDDNRGDSQDITNAFYICELFKNIKSAKIVLVVDIATLVDDSINALRTLLKAIENLLGDKFKSSFPGIAMILTKVDTIHGTPVTKDIIAEVLQGKILMSRDIDVSDAGKDLIEHLITKPQNIGFFKNAKVGPVTDDIADGVVEAINSLQAIPDQILREILPSISESAKVSLYEAREQLSSLQTFAELQDVVANVLQERLRHVENRQNNELNTNELIELSAELSVTKERMAKVLDDTMTFERKIEALKMTDSQIENHINAHRLREKAKYMEFVDKLLNLGESRNFNICLKNVLILAVQKIDELLIWVRWRIGEISKAKADEEIAKLQSRCDNDIEQLKNELQNLKAENEKLKQSSQYVRQSQPRRRCTIL